MLIHWKNEYVADMGVYYAVYMYIYNASSLHVQKHKLHIFIFTFVHGLLYLILFNQSVGIKFIFSIIGKLDHKS